MSPNATRLKEAGILEPSKLSKDELKLIEGLSEAELMSLLKGKNDDALPLNIIV